MDTSGIKSLFSADNPFRRKAPVPSPPEPAAATPSVSFLPNADEGVSANPEINTEVKNLSVISESGGDSEPATGEKKKKKRKRAEVEENYEKRMYGLSAVDEEDEKPVKVAEKKRKSAERKRKSADSTEEVAAETKSKDDGFYDESKLLRTVFVGNLPLRTKRKALAREFRRFGDVESVRIRSVPLLGSEDKKPRRAAIMIGRINEAIDSVHAYVVFKKEESAKAALSRNMTLFEDHHIRVDMACPPRKKMKGDGSLYDRKRAVFVGNLPFDIKDEEVYTLFCRACKSDKDVEAVRVVRDLDTGKGKGIAYVLFKAREVANSMCRRRDLKIRDRPIRIAHVQKHAEAPSQPTPRKRKDAEAETDESNEKNSRIKAKAASLSYQGVHSSKSGAVKKVRLNPKPTNEGWKRGSGDHGLLESRMRDHKPKQKDGKRPAVADRKLKKLQAGMPEGSHWKKKSRKH